VQISELSDRSGLTVQTIKFYIRERLYLQLEGSATNVLNRTNFGLPAQNLSASSFGRITSTQSAEGAGARQLQVGVRLSF